MFSPPSGCGDVFSPPSRCCDVSSPSSGCCGVFSLRHRMMLCVLSPAQVAAQAVKVRKVDQHPLPPPEEVVHAVEEAAHHHTHIQLKLPTNNPFTQCKCLPGGDDDMCDGLVVIGGQGGLAVSVFLLSLITPRRFFPPSLPRPLPPSLPPTLPSL